MTAKIVECALFYNLKNHLEGKESYWLSVKAINENISSDSEAYRQMTKNVCIVPLTSLQFGKQTRPDETILSGRLLNGHWTHLTPFFQWQNDLADRDRKE